MFPQWGREFAPVAMQGDAEEPVSDVLAIPVPDVPLTGVHPCEVQNDMTTRLCIYYPDQPDPDVILADAELLEVELPAWNPAGDRIAFSARQPGAPPGTGVDLYFVNPDGSELEMLKTDPNTMGIGWSPDGEWLAFHASCDLVIMHPDGSEMRQVWASEQKGCIMWPQWFPDSQRLATFVTDGVEWRFPLEREIWIIDLADDNRITSIATLVHENDECVPPEVAVSPDGLHIAYFNVECQPVLHPADGSGDPQLLEEFPWWWMGNIYPRWGLAPEKEPAGDVPEGVIEIMVPADTDWLDTGVVLHMGERFAVDVSGAINLCVDGPEDWEFCSPHGPRGLEELGTVIEMDPENIDKYPLPDAKLGTLVGQIGSGQPFLIGEGGEFTAGADGTLKLRVNDDILDNNSGEFRVLIEVAR
jgi:hypothetical protein